MAVEGARKLRVITYALVACLMFSSTLIVVINLRLLRLKT